MWDEVFNTSWYFEALKNLGHLFFHHPFLFCVFSFPLYLLQLLPEKTCWPDLSGSSCRGALILPSAFFPPPLYGSQPHKQPRPVPHKVLQPLSLVYSAQMYLCSTNLHFYCTHYHCWWRLHTGHCYASPSPLSPIWKYFLQSPSCACNLDPTCSMIW